MIVDHIKIRLFVEVMNHILWSVIVIDHLVTDVFTFLTLQTCCLVQMLPMQGLWEGAAWFLFISTMVSPSPCPPAHCWTPAQLIKNSSHVHLWCPYGFTPSVSASKLPSVLSDVWQLVLPMHLCTLPIMHCTHLSLLLIHRGSWNGKEHVNAKVS